MNQIKVFHPVSNIDLGGVERYLFNIWSCQDRSKIAFYCCVHKGFDKNKPLVKQFVGSGAQVFAMPLKNDGFLNYCVTLYKVLKQGIMTLLKRPATSSTV